MSSAKVNTEEIHSNKHAPYEAPPLTNIFESPVILSLDSFALKKNRLKPTLTNKKSPVTKSFQVKTVFLSTFLYCKMEVFCEMGRGRKTKKESKKECISA